MIETDVVIIGGGAAGLAAAHALIAKGHAVRVLEKADRLGSSWAKRHKNLSLNSHRDLSVLPGVTYPPGTTAFPPRLAVIKLLEDFARHHNLPIDFNAGVEKVERAGTAWLVQTGAQAYAARHVVVASGRDSVPFTPAWPGVEGFSGRLLHSADFGQASDYAGQSVLVAGAGNSGFDALNHIIRAETGPLWLSARHAPTLLPKRLYNLAVHRNSPLVAAMPTALGNLALALVQWLAFGSLRRLGLPQAARGGMTRLRQENIAIASDDGAIAAMKAGRITAVPPVRSFAGGEVTLEDGQVLRPDMVIAATGYRTGLEPMVRHLGVLDPRGKPLFNGGTSDPNLPGLWFTGMRPDLRGCFVHAIAQANAIAAKIGPAR